MAGRVVSRNNNSATNGSGAFNSDPSKIRFNNPQELMNYLNNPANYRPAKKKVYEIWCCLPPLGTRVRNRLEDAEYVIDPKQRFVLSGMQCEQWVISIDKLARSYTLASGEPITPESVRKYLSSGVQDLQWFKVRTRMNVTQSWACFVPAAFQFQIPTSWGTILHGNRKGVPHGRGDFVVCSDVGGQPNGNDRWIVNGAVFKGTYNNVGFTQFLDSRVSDSVVAPQPHTACMEVPKADIGTRTATSFIKTFVSHPDEGSAHKLFSYVRHSLDISIIDTGRSLFTTYYEALRNIVGTLKYAGLLTPSARGELNVWAGGEAGKSALMYINAFDDNRANMFINIAIGIDVVHNCLFIHATGVMPNSNFALTGCGNPTVDRDYCDAVRAKSRLNLPFASTNRYYYDNPENFEASVAYGLHLFKVNSGLNS